MKISELRKALDEQEKLHGDIDVEVLASYDCGYGYAGGYIAEIKMGQSTRYYRDENGMYVDEKYDVLNLCNYEG